MLPLSSLSAKLCRQTDRYVFFISLSPPPFIKKPNKHISQNILQLLLKKHYTISKEVLHNNTNQWFQPLQCLPRLQSTFPPLPWRAPPSVTRPALRRGNYTMTKDGEFELTLKMGISHSWTTACVTTRWPHCHGLDGFVVPLVFKRHFMATMMAATFFFFIYRKRYFLEAGE